MKSVLLIMLVFVVGYSSVINFDKLWGFNENFEICEKNIYKAAYIKCSNGVVYYQELHEYHNIMAIVSLYNKDGSLTQCRCG
ncbi:hypothetical protein ACT6CD_08795 [Campylobacter coli]|uniref:hypothetical protein n=1 Tax=Campylobacter coli TaxID=195 RepID=UPI00403414E8